MEATRGNHLRKLAVALALAASALASVATSDVQCPRAVSLSDEGDVAAGAAFTARYRVESSESPAVRVALRAVSDGPAVVTVRFAPEDAALFHSSSAGDATANSVDMTLRSGIPSVADFELSRCASACKDFGVALTVEHVEGASVTLTWDVIAETGSCDESHAKITRH